MSSPISVQTLNANNVNETNETYQVENNKIVGSPTQNKNLDRSTNL